MVSNELNYLKFEFTLMLHELTLAYFLLMCVGVSRKGVVDLEKQEVLI